MEERMPEPYIWSSLSRATNDATTIDEAIAQGVAAHDNDPDAHIGAGKALESHRAAEVIDHIAESVVNDKLAVTARAFIAVVGGGYAGDYETIADAVAFANGTNGGTILIMPGTHIVSSKIAISPKVNFYGIDRESCVVQVQGSANGFAYMPDANTNQLECTWENLKIIVDTGSSLVRLNSGLLASDTTMNFRRCMITCPGVFIYQANAFYRFNECKITATGTYFLQADADFRFYDCDISWGNSGASAAFSMYNASASTGSVFGFYRSLVSLVGDPTKGFYGGTGGSISEIRDCEFLGLKITNDVQMPRQIYSSRIGISTGYRLKVGGYTSTCVFSNSVFTGGLTPNVQVGSNGGTILSCVYTGQPDVSPYTLYTTESVGVPDKQVLAANGTLLDGTLAKVFELTPNSTRTITAQYGRVGTMKVLRVKPSATSYTLTFGAGFKGVPTLATGTAAAKEFILVFIVADSYWYQIYRSVAL